MTRYLKALGLALIAALATSAVAASAASAVTHTFHADGKVAYLTAKAETNQVFKATPGDAKSVVCSEVNVSGEAKGTEVGENDYSATEVEVEPTYSGCKVEEGGKEVASAKVTTKKCKYTFTGETTKTEGIEGEHATVHIKNCESETGITVDVTALNTQCIHVVNNQTLHGVRYNNQETVGGRKDITLESTVTGIKSETTNHALVCETKSGGTETHEGGTYTGNASVTGFKDAAHTEATNIWVNPG